MFRPKSPYPSVYDLFLIPAFPEKVYEEYLLRWQNHLEGNTFCHKTLVLVSLNESVSFGEW